MNRRTSSKSWDFLKATIGFALVALTSISTANADETIVVNGERITPEGTTIKCAGNGSTCHDIANATDVVAEPGGTGPGPGGYGDPRSDEEKKQCRKDVDKLVEECTTIYGATTAVLTAACTGLAVRYGGLLTAGWREGFISACLSSAAGTVYQAHQWCTMQGATKKRREC